MCYADVTLGEEQHPRTNKTHKMSGGGDGINLAYESREARWRTSAGSLRETPHFLSNLGEKQSFSCVLNNAV